MTDCYVYVHTVYAEFSRGMYTRVQSTEYCTAIWLRPRTSYYYLSTYSSYRIRIPWINVEENEVMAALSNPHIGWSAHTEIRL